MKFIKKILDYKKLKEELELETRKVDLQKIEISKLKNKIEELQKENRRGD